MTKFNLQNNRRKKTNHNNLPEPPAISTGHFFSFLSHLKNFFPTPSACSNCLCVLGSPWSKARTCEHSIWYCAADLVTEMAINWLTGRQCRKHGCARHASWPGLHGAARTENSSCPESHSTRYSYFKTCPCNFSPQPTVDLQWERSQKCTMYVGTWSRWHFMGKGGNLWQYELACSLSYGLLLNSRTWVSDSTQNFKLSPEMRGT